VRNGRAGDRKWAEHIGKVEDIADRSRRLQGLARLSGRSHHQCRPQRHRRQLRHIHRRAGESLSRHDDGTTESVLLKPTPHVLCSCVLGYYTHLYFTQ